VHWSRLEARTASGGVHWSYLSGMRSERPGRGPSGVQTRLIKAASELDCGTCLKGSEYVPPAPGGPLWRLPVITEESRTRNEDRTTGDPNQAYTAIPLSKDAVLPARSQPRRRFTFNDLLRDVGANPAPSRARARAHARTHTRARAHTHGWPRDEGASPDPSVLVRSTRRPMG
jgi:hypothetical protein